jgi:HPr kinase/phosphorylase
LNAVSVGELFATHGARLALSWVAGEGGAARTIVAERRYEPTVPPQEPHAGAGAGDGEISPTKSLIGHLNLIHPNQIQIIGYSETRYLQGLRDISRLDAIRELLRQEPACIIMAENQAVPEELLRGCADARIPLLGSSLASDKLSETLHYYLANLLAEAVTLHGVFMEVTAIGVLLTGPAGVGKSELALELITRGHRLVADDAPQFARLAPDIINGTCPPQLADFLEVRGIGVINVRELFGDSAIKSNKYLRLIIDLQPVGNQALELNRLEGSYRGRRVLDIEVPVITLLVAPGRNLAVLVECAARNHILRMSGYNSSEDFAKRQAQMVASC